MKMAITYWDGYASRSYGNYFSPSSGGSNNSYYVYPNGDLVTFGGFIPYSAYDSYGALRIIVVMVMNHGLLLELEHLYITMGIMM